MPTATKNDPITKFANWLYSPVSLPMCARQDLEEVKLRPAAELAERLMEAGKTLCDVFPDQYTAAEVAERLNVLAVALKQWATRDHFA
jgi:hypothetical protein